MMQMTLITATSRTTRSGALGFFRNAGVVKKDLKKRGLTNPFWGWTVWRLRKLEPERYTAFMNLLSKIDAENRKAEHPMILKLVLPGRTALLSMDVNRLLSTKAAMDDIIDYCYKPSKGKVTLIPISDWINAKNYQDPF
jgi:hypothetical protein